MSNCRCDDITKCERKIQKLDNTRHLILRLTSQFESISGWFSCLRVYSSSSYDTVNMSELCTYIQDQDNDLVDVRDDFQEKISAKMQELESDLSDMREEDEDYHSDDDDDEIILPDGTIVS